MPQTRHPCLLAQPCMEPGSKLTLTFLRRPSISVHGVSLSRAAPSPRTEGKDGEKQNWAVENRWGWFPWPHRELEASRGWEGWSSPLSALPTICFVPLSSTCPSGGQETAFIFLPEGPS